MRANLLRAVSHDLRTPLTAISGSIATVLEDGSQALSRQQQRELLLDAKQDARLALPHGGESPVHNPYQRR